MQQAYQLHSVRSPSNYVQFLDDGCLSTKHPQVPIKVLSQLQYGFSSWHTTCRSVVIAGLPVFIESRHVELGTFWGPPRFARRQL